MKIISVGKSLETRNFYPKAGDEKCEKCGGQMYLEMDKDNYNNMARALMMQAGEVIDYKKIPVNHFCYNCEFEGLHNIMNLLKEMDREKEFALNEIMEGKQLNNKEKLYGGLERICEVFVNFMNLFEINIEAPENIEEDDDDSGGRIITL